uniref:Transporter, lysE family n=1 Tax=Acinetobacter seifertii TaxID=1530123 RepID=A0A5P1I6A9_9GAMM|nr:transporter, lysE family [Acinetobacter seifertii]
MLSLLIIIWLLKLSHLMFEFAYYQSLILFSFIFMLISLPCLFIWAYLGKITKKILSTAHHMVLFNRVLGTVLLISVWYPILHAI